MIKNRFVLIDAFALIFRAYYALPPLVKDGLPMGAVYGFTSALLSAIKELEPEYLAVGIDLPKPTVRHKQYLEYKAHRVATPEDLMSQVPYVKELLKTFNIPIFALEGFEGEDIIATIVANVKNQISNLKKMEFIIVTGDLDCLQLVDEQTKVYSMARGVNQAVMYDIEKVKERYGLLPSQFVDFKALKGDTSDNIPGVPGIGEKTAANLIKEFGSLEKLYQYLGCHSELVEKSDGVNPKFEIRNPKQNQNSKLQKKEAKELKISEKLQTLLMENKEQAFLSQNLSKIIDNLPIDFKLADARVHDYDQVEVIRLFQKYGFRSLINRLPSEHRSDPQPKLL